MNSAPCGEFNNASMIGPPWAANAADSACSGRRPYAITRVTRHRSCQSIPAQIKGLGTPDALHAIQAAWIDNQVALCGYCQSGQIMQAADLLAKIPTPTDKDIDGAMQGNLCRCGTYPRIRAAIHDAASRLQKV